jgi:hypothetical protein
MQMKRMWITKKTMMLKMSCTILCEAMKGKVDEDVSLGEEEEGSESEGEPENHPVEEASSAPEWDSSSSTPTWKSASNASSSTSGYMDPKLHPFGTDWVGE